MWLPIILRLATTEIQGSQTVATRKKGVANCKKTVTTPIRDSHTVATFIEAGGCNITKGGRRGKARLVTICKKVDANCKKTVTTSI
jgi:hypothetical protein